MDEIQIIGKALDPSVAEEIDKERQIKAVRNFIYFTFSYSPEFISLIWGNGITGKHMEEKFREYHYDVCRFFINLDNDNQRKMIEWVMENYEG